MGPIQHSLFFKISDVLMNRGQALQTKATRNLLKRRGIALASDE